ncbi:DUF177 domain-containing protein, partial [Clostridioides difficile]
IDETFNEKLKGISREESLDKILLSANKVDSYTKEEKLKVCEEIDLIDIIEQTLDFNVPHKVLCSENCKGLCQVCGANLNEE